MNDRRPYSLLQLRELGHGLHDLPGFDTSEFRAFAVRLGPDETGLPIARAAETLLLIVEGSLTVVWCEETRVSTELGEGDVASTPPAVEVLLAGAEGATFFAMLRRVSVASCNLIHVHSPIVASNNQLRRLLCPRQS
jgi:hypothetical protein